MLTKKQIDRKVHNYIKKHSSKHSKSSIKNALVNYGFDENYVEKRFSKHNEKELMKKYLAASAVLLLASFFYFGFLEAGLFSSASLTGFAVEEAQQSNYFAVNIQKTNSTFTINSIRQITINQIIGNNNAEYSVKSFDNGNLLIEELNYGMQNNGDYIIYIPKNAESFEIYEENKVLFRYEFT